MKKRGLDLSLLDDVVDMLRQGKQLDAKYHDHGLSGNSRDFGNVISNRTGFWFI